MGLDGLFDARIETEPFDGTDRGVALQLVEYLHADWSGRQARGGDYYLTHLRQLSPQGGHKCLILNGATSSTSES